MKTKCITTTKTQKNKSKKVDEFTTFIILCDFIGHRMKSYGACSLLEIDSNKLLDIQLNTIYSYFDNTEVILCVGFDASSIVKYIRNNYKHKNIRIVENQLFDKCNSCESLRLCLNNTNNDKIFVIDGSILLNSNVFDGIKTKDNVLFTQGAQNNFEIGFNVNEKKTIEYISFGAYNIWSEILYMNSATENMRKILFNGNYKNKLIFEAVNDLIKMKNNFYSFVTKSNVDKISNINVYHKLRK